jgi:hypothetical protein
VLYIGRYDWSYECNPPFDAATRGLLKELTPRMYDRNVNWTPGFNKMGYCMVVDADACSVQLLQRTVSEVGEQGNWKAERASMKEIVYRAGAEAERFGTLSVFLVREMSWGGWCFLERVKSLMARIN